MYDDIISGSHGCFKNVWQSTGAWSSALLRRRLYGAFNFSEQEVIFQLTLSPLQRGSSPISVRPVMTGHQCWVCGNTMATNPSASFHRVPKDQSRRAVCIQALHVSDNQIELARGIFLMQMATTRQASFCMASLDWLQGCQSWSETPHLQFGDSWYS